MAVGPGSGAVLCLTLGLLSFLAGCDRGGGDGGWILEPGSGERQIVDQLLQRNVSAQPLPVTILARGNKPTGGGGPRELRVIYDQAEFADVWVRYTPDDLPEIDFNENVVVLRDRGSTDLNHCGGIPVVSGVTARLYDEAVTEVVFHLELPQDCTQKACIDSIDPGGPFILVAVSKAGTLAVRASEQIEMPICDRSSLPAGALSAPSPVVSTVLLEGTDPLIGPVGPRRAVLINNEWSFAEIWSEYSNTTPPEIDFWKSAVALYDEGFPSTFPCTKRVSLVDVDATRVLSPLNTEVTTVHFSTAVTCAAAGGPDCESIMEVGRHFLFVKVDERYNNLSGDMLMSEEIVFPRCGTR